MKQITLNISDSKFQTFIEFIKTLNYVEIPKAEEEALNEFQTSLEQVKMMTDGKIEKQSVEEFLDEL